MGSSFVRKQSDLRSGSGAAQGRRARGPAPPGRAQPAIGVADPVIAEVTIYTYQVDNAFTKAINYDPDQFFNKNAQDFLRQLDVAGNHYDELDSYPVKFTDILL